jgi:hypothetical protein
MTITSAHINFLFHLKILTLYYVYMIIIDINIKKDYFTKHVWSF